jgi:hypothetical protein
MTRRGFLKGIIAATGMALAPAGVANVVAEFAEAPIGAETIRSASVTTMMEVLKQLYPHRKIVETVYEQNPFFAMLPGGHDA